MSGKKRNLSPDEKLLWRRVAATVKARRALAPEPEEDAAPEPIKVRLKSAKPPAPAKTTPIAKPVAPVADRGAERNVRRGKVEIDARIDLHGHTQDSARAALIAFVESASARRLKTILVITGAGRSGEGVLKKRFPDWLNAPAIKPLISGMAQAHRAHGGAGAFYVFLKRK